MGIAANGKHLILAISSYDAVLLEADALTPREFRVGGVSGGTTRSSVGGKPQAPGWIVSMPSSSRFASLPAVPPSTVSLPLDQEQLDEPERVLAWRISRLVEAGYCDEGAAALACSAVDLHSAVELVERGCPPELALRILL